MFLLIFLNITIENPRDQVAGHQLRVAGDHEVHKNRSMNRERV